MSEILANHPGIVQRRAKHNDFRLDNVSWLCDGHECPSYMRSFRHCAQNLIQLQHVLANKRNDQQYSMRSEMKLASGAA